MDKKRQVALQGLMLTAEKICAKDLASLLNQFSSQINILSLDCFDTLIWRKTLTPKDVFYQLQHFPIYQKLKINVHNRLSAEGHARQVKALKSGIYEVKLLDIYQGMNKNFSEADLNELMEAELAIEKNLCFAFQPVVDLIHAAYAKGMKIIIVSDTYYTESQLRQLLTDVMPADALAKINNIFCSCDYNSSKSDKLFLEVIKQLKCLSGNILHIGDNMAADYAAPISYKMNARLFKQYDDYVGDLLRLQETAAKMLDPAIHSSQALYAPFRPVFALNNFAVENPEKLIGYAALGPIMFAFANFIGEEIKKIKLNTKQVKVLFLMRDAYLPWIACNELLGETIGTRVRISRFASYAASFFSEEDIDSYLIEIGATNRFQDVAKQLLLPAQVYEPLISVAMRSHQPDVEFFKLVRRKDIVNIILRKSEKYRERLISHLKVETGLTAGDTLVFIDLGYSGTAQRRLAPVFEKMNINVIGRYLLSLRVLERNDQRFGLIDPSWCDDKAIQTVVFYITLLEQLCTSNERSVIDYDEEGNAIYSDIIMSEQQHQKLDKIQKECIQFIRDAKVLLASSNIQLPIEILRQSALNELSRLIFLPTEVELQYLKHFQAEMNLGTQDILRVFDPEQGLTGLRRRGMFYIEKPSKLTRTNYPAELRSAGIEMVLSLIAQHRFGLDLKMKDMALRRETLQIVFRQGEEAYKTSVEAVATHDGFFAVWLPTNLQTYLMWGENYEWIQIESAEYIPMEAFINQNEAQNTTDAWPNLVFNKMENNSGNLFRLTSDKSTMQINPINPSQSNDCVIRIVFRPIVKQLMSTINSSYSFNHASV